MDGTDLGSCTLQSFGVNGDEPSGSTASILRSRRYCVFNKPNRFNVEAFTALCRNSVFWDITLCGRVKVNRCFGGTCRLQHQVNE
jgi:hypothetical protein